MHLAMCEIAACDKPRRKRGWCETHYSRFKASGSPSSGGRTVRAGACSIDDCSAKPTAKALCKRHYYQTTDQKRKTAARSQRVKDSNSRAQSATSPPPQDFACSLDGCMRERQTGGYCDCHYRRMLRNGEPGPPEIGFSRSPEDYAPCSVEGCAKQAKVRGWCGAHYQRWRRFGNPLHFPEPRDRTCSIEGCERMSNARKLCSAHYRRWQLYGDPLITHWSSHTAKDGERRCSVTSCIRRTLAPGSKLCNMHYQRNRKHGDVSIRSIPRVSTCVTCGSRFDPGDGRARKYCGRLCKPSGRIAGSVNMRRWVDKIGNEDGWVCWLCNHPVAPALFWPHQYAGSVDHVIPASLGGTDERHNLRLAHLTCNCSRSNRLIEETD